MKFLKDVGKYLMENKLSLILLVVSVVAILTLIIVLIAVGKKRKKKAKAQQLAQAEQAPQTAPVEQTPEKAETPAPVAQTPVKEEAPVQKEVSVTAPKQTTPAKPASTPVAKKTVSKPAVATEKKTEPTPPKAKPVEKKAEKPATAQHSKYAGKWTIYHLVVGENNTEDEMYFFELHASNGEKLLASEEYTSYNGVLKGIETYKANIAKGNFKISMTKKGDYIFKLMSGKNTLLCNGENYASFARCESAIQSTKRFAETAVLDEDVRQHVIKVPVETETEVTPLPEGLAGKWLISSHDVNGAKVFYFELFANNGEKLLSSEEYTTYIGAVNGIQTHKQNIAKGNFRISLTKNGDYIYKLLNGNNQLLCLGEHYKTKVRCKNAVESVKRFAMSSPTLTEAGLLEQ